jgi:hypothetical protein
MPPRTLRTLCLAVLTRLASGSIAPKRHATLYLAGWLVARAVSHSTFIHGRVV